MKLMQTPDNARIHTIDDLHAEMKHVKNRVKETELSLVKRMNQVPGEAAKSAAEAILPLFLGNELASGAWKLVKGAFDLVKGKTHQTGETGNNWKDNVVGGAKNLGVLAALKLLFNLWKSK